MLVPRCLFDLGLGVRVGLSEFILKARENLGGGESAPDSGEDGEDEEVGE